MKYMICVLIFAALANPALAQVRPMTASERASISKSLADQLKDPASAKFKFTPIISGKTSGVICGQVNARNSYGGYTGFQPFIAMTAKNTSGRTIGVFVSQGSVNVSDGQIALQMCADKGLSVGGAK
jgi:hypothetical protein